MPLCFIATNKLQSRQHLKLDGTLSNTLKPDRALSNDLQPEGTLSNDLKPDSALLNTLKRKHSSGHGL